MRKGEFVYGPLPDPCHQCEATHRDYNHVVMLTSGGSAHRASINRKMDGGKGQTLCGRRFWYRYTL